MTWFIFMLTHFDQLILRMRNRMEFSDGFIADGMML